MSQSKLTTREQLQSIWHLGGLTPKQLAQRVWAEIFDDDLLGRAAELAYNFILAVFPLLLFLIALFGLFASRGSELRENLLFYFSQVLPPSAFHVVSNTITEISQKSGGGKLTFGLVLTLWFAAGGMASMISALNGAYNVHESRSWFKVRGIALGLTVGISVLIVTALISVLAGGVIADFIGSKLHLGVAAMAWKIAQWPLAVIFVMFSYSVIYYFAPDLKEQHWYWITPGSIFGVLLWIAASFVFRTYLHYFNTYGRTYGSLGAVIILMVWFYVTGLAFLIGGEINAEIEHAAAERGHPEAKPEGKKAA